MSRAASVDDFRATVSLALRRRVGTGRRFTVDQLATAIGRGRRTVEGWLYGETAPRGEDLSRLIAFFEGDFANEILGGTGKVVIDRAALERLPQAAEAMKSLAALGRLLEELGP